MKRMTAITKKETTYYIYDKVKDEYIFSGNKIQLLIWLAKHKDADFDMTGNDKKIVLKKWWVLKRPGTIGELYVKEELLPRRYRVMDDQMHIVNPKDFAEEVEGLYESEEYQDYILEKRKYQRRKNRAKKAHHKHHTWNCRRRSYGRKAVKILYDPELEEYLSGKDRNRRELAIQYGDEYKTKRCPNNWKKQCKARKSWGMHAGGKTTESIRYASDFFDIEEEELFDETLTC